MLLHRHGFLWPRNTDFLPPQLSYLSYHLTFVLRHHGLCGRCHVVVSRRDLWGYVTLLFRNYGFWGRTTSLLCHPHFMGFCHIVGFVGAPLGPHDIATLSPRPSGVRHHLFVAATVVDVRHHHGLRGHATLLICCHSLFGAVRHCGLLSRPCEPM